MLDKGAPSPSFDELRTGQALSQRERGFTPFALWEKGWG
jgi:hypothetical protein